MVHRESQLSKDFCVGASVIGRLSLGYMSDKVDPWLLGLSTLCLTALTTFILWGILSNSFAGLMAFGLAYGIIAGGWTSLWTAFIQPLASASPFLFTNCFRFSCHFLSCITEDDIALSTSLFGYLLLSRGFGNILSTPITTSLLRGNQSTSIPYHHDKTGFDVGGGRFENVILYAGTCFCAASVIAVVGWGVEKSMANRARARV